MRCTKESAITRLNSKSFSHRVGSPQDRPPSLCRSDGRDRGKHGYGHSLLTCVHCQFYLVEPLPHNVLSKTLHPMKGAVDRFTSPTSQPHSTKILLPITASHLPFRKFPSSDSLIRPENLSCDQIRYSSSHSQENP